MKQISGRGYWLGLVVLGALASSVRADDNKPMDDATFVKKAACAGMAEVKSSEIALQKASDAKVKQFAQRMIDDHTKANKELTELATRKGWKPEAAIEEKKQKEMDKLSGKTGQEFDRAYMECQVKAHEEAVKLFKQASTASEDADLKAWAAKTLPTLEEHLKMAQSAGEKTPR
jgi:putative membrane protein